MNFRNVLHRIASNFAWSMASVAIGRFIFFYANIYLARKLGVKSYGMFTLAQSITFYFWLAVDLGTNMYGIREIAKDKENSLEIINPLLTLRITAGTVIFFIYMMVLFFFDLAPMERLTFTGCGLYLISYAFYADWILKGLEKFKYIAVGSLISSLSFLVGILFFVKNEKGLVILSFIWPASFFVGGISMLYFLVKKMGLRLEPNFTMQKWWTHIKKSIFFTVSGGLMILYQYLPILLIGFFLSSYEVGLFSAPYRTINSFCNLGSLILMAFYPVLSDAYAKDKKVFVKTGRLLLLLLSIGGGGISILGFIYSKEAILFLFGDSYRGSIELFHLLIWLVCIIYLRFSVGIIIVSMGLQRLQAFSSSMALMAGLLSGVILISIYGITGAAVSILISEGVALVFMYVIYVKYKKFMFA